jgi:hypothetical protein
VEVFIFSGGVRGWAAALFIFFGGGGVGPLLTLGGKVVAKLIDSFFWLPRAESDLAHWWKRLFAMLGQLRPIARAVAGRS